MANTKRITKERGRPKELREDTERITFHLEKSIAKELRSFVTPKNTISNILREAATEYLENRTDKEINELKNTRLDYLWELYERAKEYRINPKLGSRIPDIILETSQYLLEIVSKEPIPKPPKDLNEEMISEYQDIIETVADELLDVRLDVFGRMVRFLGRYDKCMQKLEWLKSSLEKTLETAKKIDIKQISIPPKLRSKVKIQQSNSTREEKEG